MFGDHVISGAGGGASEGFISVISRDQCWKVVFEGALL